MGPLDFPLERDVVICAQRSTVFRYFTDSKRFAAWWGEGSRIEARPGGALLIRYPNGATASGQVEEVLEGRRVVFTFGYDSGNPIPAGSSRVTITLEDHARGTRVNLRHDLPDAKTRDAHVQGWRYHLSVFSNVVAGEQHARVGEMIDLYFQSWGVQERVQRRELLARCATDAITFQDPYSSTAGIDELNEQLGAFQVHMPGMALRRDGEPRQCQGTAVCAWIAAAPDGSTKGRGTNVFTLAADGRIASVVGLWDKT